MPVSTVPDRMRPAGGPLRRSTSSDKLRQCARPLYGAAIRARLSKHAGWAVLTLGFLPFPVR